MKWVLLMSSFAVQTLALEMRVELSLNLVESASLDEQTDHWWAFLGPWGLGMLGTVKEQCRRESYCVRDCILPSVPELEVGRGVPAWAGVELSLSLG